jgi:hypothetical protein
MLTSEAPGESLSQRRDAATCVRERIAERSLQGPSYEVSSSTLAPLSDRTHPCTASAERHEPGARAHEEASLFRRSPSG